MNLKVEWANNPKTFKDVEDWNAVTIKHLNPKRRNELQGIIDSCKENLITITDLSDYVNELLLKDQEYRTVEYIDPIGFKDVFLVQNNKFGTRVIRLIDKQFKL